jgi:hypothetical protein
MMMPFVKLDCGILDSSLWEEDSDTCKTFVTILAMCGPDGVCRATTPGIARRANLSKEIVAKAVAKLESPDKDSRSQEDEGRRIRRVDGGYYVVNYLKYRAFETPEAKRVSGESVRRLLLALHL